VVVFAVRDVDIEGVAIDDFYDGKLLAVIF
jgi:hypothetical protein